MAGTTHQYILVMGQVYLERTFCSSAPEGLHVVPEEAPGGEWIEVSEGDLGGQTLDEFFATHKPVYTGATPVFDSWASRDNGLGAVQSAPLYYDGSNAPTLTLSGGAASSAFSVVVSRGILCSTSEGTLDGSGGAVFSIRNVSATAGSLQVLPRGNSDFEELTHVIEFETWSP